MKLLEQLIGGFVAPGDEDTFFTEKGKPDFGNFIMSSKKLLDGGLSVGDLVEKLSTLPEPDLPGREEDNSYEYPRDALQTIPTNNPG